MGYMRHHSIIVTSGDKNAAIFARKTAKKVFGKSVSLVVPSQRNGYYSFFIGPDGSKLGWDEDERGDENRDKFIRHLETSKQYYRWVEVQYGDDSGIDMITRKN